MGSDVSVPENEVETKNEVSFTVQGKVHNVRIGSDVQGQPVTPETSLATYLRDFALMKDTKTMCREGGCGVCVVSVSLQHPRTGRHVTMAVNSCLVPVLACHNWVITTAHGIGNREMGYHPLQKALVEHQGTQCGFCSPGMLMNMYALVQSRDVLTTRDVQDSFGGNLCRCTGYRPIMDAFRDIEDLRPCQGGCCVVAPGPTQPFRLALSAEQHWYKAYSLPDILRFFRHVGDASYRLVAGNTAHGVYKILHPVSYWLDIRCVKELAAYSLDGRGHLLLGANTSLSDAMQLLRKTADEDPQRFSYLDALCRHLDLVAHVPVRNVGTLAGNLMIKHEHPEFPSDVFVLLEAVGAELTVVREDGKEVKMSPADFLRFDMRKCVVRSVALPALARDAHVFRSYKVMPRWQNAHAQLNAAFLVELSGGKVKRARLVYGAVSPGFVHATGAEHALVGRALHRDASLQAVLAALDAEVRPDHVLPDPSPEFRKRLALSLYYKFFLATAPADAVAPRLRSGGGALEHPLMTGAQLYETFPDTYPVSQPVPKLEGLIQASGEAQYIDDMPPLPGELFGAFVLAEETPHTEIKSIDATEAKTLPGVVTFLSYKDIPGSNLFSAAQLMPDEEKLFAENIVEYNGQPVGIVIADTYERAVYAATKVKITFKKTTKKPMFTIQDVLNNNENKRIILESTLEAKKTGKDVKKVLKGVFKLQGQFHFHMETQRCICVPTDEGGLEIYASSQWMDQIQIAAAKATNIPMHKVHVQVKRVGGAYGAKISRAVMVSTACAVAAAVLKCPMRIIMPLEINMKALGKRFPTYAEYEVGVNDKGAIQYLKSDFYQAGATAGRNESILGVQPIFMSSGYNNETWNLKVYNVRTDMAGNAFCRGPVATEAVGFIETIMDHIAFELSVSPVQVREANFSPTTKLPQVLATALDWTKYTTKLKEAEDFNAKNRWMKRGVSLTLMDYTMMWLYPYSVFIAIYGGDGTVNVSHGGTEIGQGINTKVVQVVAYELGIPMEMISTRPNDSFTAPNNQSTGGSVTSESVCYAAILACNKLNERLKPFKEKMKGAPWPEIISKASLAGIDLSATAYSLPEGQKFSIEKGIKLRADAKNMYPLPAVCVCTVQVDVLTGEHVVLGLDLLEDVGHSLSPGVDAGQLEGALAMGTGMYTTEELVYGPQGQLLTANTWTYKPPTLRDLPHDLRIMFLHNSGNPPGVLNSKATGEPSLCMSVSVPNAIRNALISAQKDAKNVEPFLNVDGAMTIEYKLMHSSTNYKDFKL